MDKPTVDVIMPVYNCEAYIADALQSLLNQTYPITRIFILDDASNDSTLEIIEKFDDPRIDLNRSDQNEGVVKQLNRGISLSKSDYIARMDGDDICFPDRIFAQIEFLEKNADYVACSGGFQSIDAEGMILNETILDNSPNNPESIPAHQHFLKHPFLMMNSEAVKAIEGYHQIHFCEDADLYYRLTTKGKLHNLPEILGKYRIHKGSISSKDEVTNKLQSLHSQLSALHFRRARYEYDEKIAQTLYSKTIDETPSIKDFLDLSKEIYGLNENEFKWLTKAFPIKYLQNILHREIKLSKTDLRFYYFLMIKLIGNCNGNNLKSLRILFKLLRKLITTRNGN